MQAPYTQYAPGALIVLVGENPLPNYVAVRLLAGLATRVVFVYTAGTGEQKKRLIELLTRDGYDRANLTECPINDSDPAAIRRVIEDSRRAWGQNLHINYTGGTKAMAVNVMLSLREPMPFSSYVDARTLSLWVEGPGVHSAARLAIGTQVPITVSHLLYMHGLAELVSPMRSRSILPVTTHALATIHASAERRLPWQRWVKGHFRLEDKGTLRLRGKNQTEQLQNAAMLVADLDPLVRSALTRDIGDLTTYADIAAKREDDWPFAKTDEKLLMWLEGGWLEDYTLAQILANLEASLLSDVQANINPKLPGNDNKFEFDVACTIGHQLFAFSCTTAGKEHLKAKLLEAVVRANQIGGAEARVALVCCEEDKQVQRLRAQVGELTDKNRLEVFGADHIPDLGRHIADWIHLNVREAV